MPIDFPQAQTPDFLQIYQQSFEQGRQLGRQRALAAALARYRTDPKGGAEALGALDPELLRRSQQQDDEAQLRRMRVQDGALTLKDHARREAGRHAAGLIQILRGLRAATTDPAQRLAMAQHAAEQFPQFGLSAEDVAGHDLSDTGIDSLIQQLTPFAVLHQEDGPRGAAVSPPATAPDPWTGR